MACLLVMWEAVCAHGQSEGRATGLVCKPGILVGKKKANALKKAFGEEKPDIGLGDRQTDAPFMALCKVINTSSQL